MEMRHIEARRGPLGVSARCPFCRHGAYVRFSDGYRPGFAATQAARKRVWDHIKEHHREELDGEERQ